MARASLAVPYALQEKLADGSFGAVFRATKIEPPQELASSPSCSSPSSLHETNFAVKVIDLEESTSELEEIQHEISVLSHCAHPYLVQYFGSYLIDTKLWVVMEFMQGSLYDLMNVDNASNSNCNSASDNEPFSEDAIAYILKDLLLGLQYLHSSRKIHRDVKAKNCLVSSSGLVKLADFGEAAQLTDTINKRMTFVGSPFWMAPEVISQSKYDLKADIWSLGITAIELCEGKPPWSDVHPMKVLFLIPKEPGPRLAEGKGKGIRDFVEMCCEKESGARPTAELLLESAFIQGMNGERGEGARGEVLERIRRRNLSLNREEGGGGKEGENMKTIFKVEETRTGGQVVCDEWNYDDNEDEDEDEDDNDQIIVAKITRQYYLVQILLSRGDTTIGTVELKLNSNSSNLHRATVQNIFVGEKLRRAGLGTRLLNEAEAFAKRENVRVLQADCAVNQDDFAKLASKCGFTNFGRMAGYGMTVNGEFVDGLFFSKEVGVTHS